MSNQNRTEQLMVLQVDFNSDTPKYQELVNGINNALANNTLVSGDALPSVNTMCKDYSLSRDTVFKAYSILKEQGVIESVPNKGYFVASETKKVLLVLDTFKAYKEVLYHAFINNLSEHVIVDVQFHHYNIENFKTILSNSIGKYYKYVVMNFNNKAVKNALAGIDRKKLLLIDWNIFASTSNNYVFQDFGKAVYSCLNEAKPSLKKYEKLVFVYPDFTYHPIETLESFKTFCQEHHFNFKIVTSLKTFQIKKGEAYLSVSDRVLGAFLEQCRANNLEPGTDVGFLSYNETPMKKFIYKGISVISTNFEAMGQTAAHFINTDTEVKQYIPTKLILRESL